MKIAADNPILAEAVNVDVKKENSEIKWTEFVVRENILLDANLSLALKIDQQLVIPIGKYPVTLYEGYFSIQFKTVPL